MTIWCDAKTAVQVVESGNCVYLQGRCSTPTPVEGKANLVCMLEFVQLTEDEKLLVTEGIELHQALIEKLIDVPTPAGPTPRELGA